MKIGLQAINNSGIQRTFAENLAQQSRELGPIALRTPNTPSQRYAEIAAAKSMDVKVKSSNWGPTIGHVSLENTFGRIDNKGLLLPPKQNPANVDHYVVQEQTGLRDIFSRVGKEYRITDFDDESGQLTFSILDPYKNRFFEGQFLISLSEGISNTTLLEKRFTRDIDIPNEGQDKKILEQIAACIPNWDETRYGAFTDILNKHYPLYSTSTQEASAEPTPVWVYANASKKPFTSDWDMLWVGFPGNALPKTLIPLAQTPINTQLPGNMDILNDSIPPLIESLTASGKIEASLGEMILKNRQTHDVGVITPWEYLRVLMGNTEYQDPYISHLFQHGPENRTPYHPETLNGPVLHFIEGQILLTETEHELLQLISDQNNRVDKAPHFLDNYFLHIHPKWSEPAYSAEPETWKNILMKQAQKWQDELGITPPALSLKNSLDQVNHTSSELPSTLTILDRFHVAKNKDFINLHQPDRLAIERLSVEQQLNLTCHLQEKAEMMVKRLKNEDNQD
jgi:hypothetical protein